MCEQFVVRTAFDYVAAVDEQDLVRVRDGRQAVRHHDHGAQQQLGQRRLAGAAGADERGDRARPQLQVDVAQHLVPLVVTEPDGFEANEPGLGFTAVSGIRCAGGEFGSLLHLVESLGRRGRGTQGLATVAETHQRTAETETDQQERQHVVPWSWPDPADRNRARFGGVVQGMTAQTSDHPVVDTGTEFGAKVAERLGRESVIWLTTVGPSGTPQPNPVWFQWRDGEFLLFSQRDKAKVRNIARNPRVSLNLNSTESGGDIVVLTGTARIAEEWPSDDEIAAYNEKYAGGYVEIGMTADEFYAEYSVPVRITPDRLRGF